MYKLSGVHRSTQHELPTGRTPSSHHLIILERETCPVLLLLVVVSWLRYVMQLRQPSSGSFLLLGTADPLVYEEWVEDILYVQQR